ncbi:MAG: DUF4147 domain-containing protein, partial [Pirellulales bacterium]
MHAQRRSTERLRQDALAIWQAGLDAVRSERLIAENVSLDKNLLKIGDDSFDLDSVGRIAVVGGGKAGAGMAAAVEAVLGEALLKRHDVTGWVNVPDDCVRPLARIKLHGGRPAGVNEPTAAGAAGAAEILRIVESLAPRDLCLCLLSGGGSALLPAPCKGVTLEDKIALVRYLSGAGANIEELNTVRKQLSAIKGGRLARRCRAGRLISLIISDVIGDPLDMIASGPTAPDTSTPSDALEILQRFAALEAGVAARLVRVLEQKQAQREFTEQAPTVCPVTNLVIGNNAKAVDAAGREALRRGYSHVMSAATELEGEAEEVGRHHARMALTMLRRGGPDCLITGGEPVVKLAEASIRGRGGRNQQLVLAAGDHLAAANDLSGSGVVILSGGTDGEDGPTDAAGAWLDLPLLGEAEQKGLDRHDHLRRNDAYPFFAALDALIKTGPTHTNVCDVRVVLVDRRG